ncbi:peptidylprolyl isomerase [Streptobacillus felis]|uniref:peptidylprolyl isomerase n=1 Tax=Streptobacillus felis TaxID=1384509 RepID=A0A7Z0T6K0_9FUSO|nr:peptidylprolyl isomerase [Streptobacillus felis]NYV27276.1 peptidylprolyl isomerase [Streptobacillus felis]
MALKKMGRPMKIITVFIAIAMLIPVFMSAYTYFTNKESKTVILKIDGEKIYKEDFEQKFADFSKQIEGLNEQVIKANNLDKEKFEALPEEITKGYVLAGQIYEALSNVLTTELGATVSKTEINQKFKELEDQMGGSKGLVAALNAQGQTIEGLRETIKGFLLNDKKLDIIKQKISVSDTEIENRFNQQKFTEFEGKSFAEVKDDVKNQILTEKARIYEKSLMENKFNTANFSVSDKTIEPVLNKLKEIIFEKDEYKFTYMDVISQVVNLFFQEGKGYTEEFQTKVRTLLETDLDKKIRIKDKALEAGLSLNQDLLPKYQLEYIAEDYVSQLLGSYKASEEEMRAIFNKYEGAFDIPHTVSGEIIGMAFIPNDEDAKETEAKVAELMKTITKENFAEKAKELSKDPGSAQNGGDLGKANINNYVPEFKEAVAKAEAGTIVGPVKTQFGYHIILVEEKDKDNKDIATLKHILIGVEPGDKTKEETKGKVLEIKDLITSKKLTWENITSDTTGKYKEFGIKDHFSKIKENDKLPVVGYDKAINSKLFSANVGEFIEISLEDSFVIIQKTEDIPYKKVGFDEVKEKLNYIAATEYVTKHLLEI